MGSDPGRDWRGDAVDLESYLERIGFDGPPSTSAETLRALVHGHALTFPFENLEILLGRPILLDLEDVQDKLVHRRRGGYCFEHVRLFAAVLERFGFTFSVLLGRVTMGSASLRPGTHALPLVTTDDGRRWICDVGFGGGPLEPIPFEDGAHTVRNGWEHRLDRMTDALDGLPGVEQWELSQLGADGWFQRHHFVVAPVFPIDFQVLSHFTSTHPRSPFTTRPYLQRITEDVHHQFDGSVHTVTRPGVPPEKRSVRPGQVLDLLRESFAIDLDADDGARIVEAVRRHAAGG